jgi:N-acetylmuramoyl-L-alanine amidase
MAGKNMEGNSPSQSEFPILLKYFSWKCRFARMKIARLLLCLLALGWFELPAAAAPAARSVRPKYVLLEDWARKRQFSVRSIALTKSVELSNRTARLVFSVDPRKDRTRMTFNGVQISLVNAVHYERGKAYVSQLDLTQTLEPLLLPKRNPAGKVRTICLDAGHGGKDPGNGRGYQFEKKYTLPLAQDIRTYLKQAGFEVILTRSSDVFIDLPPRIDLANRRGADLFVSLHFNAFPASKAVKGVETYCLTPAGAFSSNSGGQGDTRWVTGNRENDRSLLLAYQVQRALVRKLPVEDRGVKRARFKVLQLATMPAILVEGGFMSNPTEAKRIADPAYRKQMARAIADGIIAYRNAVEK